MKEWRKSAPLLPLLTITQDCHQFKNPVDFNDAEPSKQQTAWEYRHVTKEQDNKKTRERKREEKHGWGKRTLEDKSMASLEKGREYMTLSTENGELNREQCGSRTVTWPKMENESDLAHSCSGVSLCLYWLDVFKELFFWKRRSHQGGLHDFPVHCLLHLQFISI